MQYIYLNNTKRKVYTCHSERSATESKFDASQIESVPSTFRNPKTCNQFLNNIQRKAYTCHSERNEV